jgi:hypothetical protein
MGRSKGTPKSVLIATRVTPRINEMVKQMANREGLYVSEWVRKIIITELSNNNMLGKPLYTPLGKNDDYLDESDLRELYNRE